MDPFETVIDRRHGLVLVADFAGHFPTDARAIRLVNLGPGAALLHGAWLDVETGNSLKERDMLPLVGDRILAAGEEVPVLDQRTLRAAADAWRDPGRGLATLEVARRVVLRASVSAVDGDYHFMAEVRHVHLLYDGSADETFAIEKLTPGRIEPIGFDQ